MFSKLRLENQEKKTVYLCLNNLILLYGGRSAEREVSVLSAESVMRAVDYSAFEVKTYFITQSGDFIKTQEFTETPGDDEKLMTNDTVVASQAINQAIFTKKALWYSRFFMDQWVRMVLSKVSSKPSNCHMVGTNVLSSSVAMDKIMTKHILEVAGVPQVAYTVFIEGEDLEVAVAETLEKLTFPDVCPNLLTWGHLLGFLKLKMKQSFVQRLIWLSNMIVVS